MLRKLMVMAGLSIGGAAMGCSMCQDCLDGTGPDPGSPNFGDFNHSPRAGSINSPVITEGAPVVAEGVVTEEVEVVEP